MQFDTFLPPREVSVLAGASGSGKSTLLLQLLHAWNKNESFIDIGAPPSGVSYIAGDRSIHSLYHRAADIGLDMQTIPHASMIDNSDVDIRMFQYDAISLLFNILDKLKGPLFIVDPLIIFLGVDLNRYHLVAPALIRLNRFCQDKHYTLLGTHHTTKARSDFSFLRPQDRISGSSALSAFTSTQIALTAPDEVAGDNPMNAARLDIVSHIAAPETHWLSRDKQGLYAPMGPEAGAILQQCGAAGLAIYHAIPDGAQLPTTTILSTLDGIASRATVFRQLDKLCALGVITKALRGHYERTSVKAVPMIDQGLARKES